MSDKNPPKIKSVSPKPYILGLDLGTSSIGWAAIEIETDANGIPLRNRPSGILGMGVRRFDAGVSGTQDDIRKGKDQSHATDRRSARSARRLSWRRKRRKQRVYRMLAHLGLLPNCDVENPDAITASIQDLDRTLQSRHVSDGDRRASHVLTYILRAKALDEELQPHELGRALYHLSQRRGFLSNRKAPPKKDEDDGVVKASIAELYHDISATDCRTLGEYLSKIDPEGDTRLDGQKRIRGRWTARQMYLDEFNAIIEYQKQYHEAFRNTDQVSMLRDAIFDQRPLRSQASLIGTCDLVPGRRRAAVASIPFQRFRLQQKLNDLSYVDHDGEVKTLTRDQRDSLRDALISEGDLTWARVRKILKLKPKKKETGLPMFRHEEGGEKKLIGDRTSAKIRSIVGDVFDEWEESYLTELVDDIRSYADEEILTRRLRQKWKMHDTTATELAAIRLEPGYGSLSRRAINLLMPKMQRGIAFRTAVSDTPELQDTPQPVAWPLLPPQGDNAKLWKENQKSDRLIYQSFSSPTVARTLSEMRKVVNALIRRHGRPSYIRVELARDLKNSRKRRMDLTRRRDQNQARRAKAKERILQECGNSQPTRSDVEKFLLAEECGFVCPYTGKVITPNSLFSAEFEIEHIIPFSLSFDNSFANKTISHRDANREKSNRTPFDCFGGRTEWEGILQRVKRFDGPYARRKLDLFQREQPEQADFLERQLSETRYIARQATEYLSLLYGGIVEKAEEDEPGTRRVLVTPGYATSLLRNGWQLQAVTGGRKNRADHRHHAVDALVIALTQDGFLKRLSDAAANAKDLDLPRLTTEIQLPWESFIADAKKVYESIFVSCRPNRKLNGGLHKDTVFSKPLIDRKADPKAEKFFAVRRPLVMISKTEVGNIVDDRIREIVIAHLDAHQGDLKAAFSDPANHPHLKSKDGRIIPIHKVRVHRREKPKRIGKGPSTRYVVPGANHHLKIVAKMKNGDVTKWRGQIVNRLDAKNLHEHWKANGGEESGEPSPLSATLVNENEQLVFTLMPGDHLLIDLEDGPQMLCRVNNISESEIELQRHHDARSATELRKVPGGRIRRSPENLRRDNAQKVEVSPLGEISRAGR
jgi:CRISPR-associated endonuclease Csn1